MEITWSYDTPNIQWDALSHLYEIAPLGIKTKAYLKTAMGNSRFKCFAFCDGQLVGAGRALADGVDCSYLCDIIGKKRIDLETKRYTFLEELYWGIVMQAFTRTVIKIIKSIPEGKVCTYGRIALMAGQPKGARQVVRILHAMSRRHDLPWHRVINAHGFISLPESNGYEKQKSLLQGEGVQLDKMDWIDLKRYLWTGRNRM